MFENIRAGFLFRTRAFDRKSYINGLKTWAKKWDRLA